MQTLVDILGSTCAPCTLSLQVTSWDYVKFDAHAMHRSMRRGGVTGWQYASTLPGVLALEGLRDAIGWTLHRLTSVQHDSHMYESSTATPLLSPQSSPKLELG